MVWRRLAALLHLGCLFLYAAIIFLPFWLFVIGEHIKRTPAVTFAVGVFLNENIDNFLRALHFHSTSHFYYITAHNNNKRKNMQMQRRKKTYCCEFLLGYEDGLTLFRWFVNRFL